MVQNTVPQQSNVLRHEAKRTHNPEGPRAEQVDIYKYSHSLPRQQVDAAPAAVVNTTRRVEPDDARNKPAAKGRSLFRKKPTETQSSRQRGAGPNGKGNATLPASNRDVIASEPAARPRSVSITRTTEPQSVAVPSNVRLRSGQQPQSQHRHTNTGRNPNNREYTTTTTVQAAAQPFHQPGHQPTTKSPPHSLPQQRSSRSLSDTVAHAANQYPIQQAQLPDLRTSGKNVNDDTTTPAYLSQYSSQYPGHSQQVDPRYANPNANLTKPDAYPSRTPNTSVNSRHQPQTQYQPPQKSVPQANLPQTLPPQTLPASHSANNTTSNPTNANSYPRQPTQPAPKRTDAKYYAHDPRYEKDYPNAQSYAKQSTQPAPQRSDATYPGQYPRYETNPSNAQPYPKQQYHSQPPPKRTDRKYSDPYSNNKTIPADTSYPSNSSSKPQSQPPPKRTPPPQRPDPRLSTDKYANYDTTPPRAKSRGLSPRKSGRNRWGRRNKGDTNLSKEKSDGVEYVAVPVSGNWFSCFR